MIGESTLTITFSNFHFFNGGKMTDAERIKNLEQENHDLRETAREWKNACEKELETNTRLVRELDRLKRELAELKTR